MIVKIIMEIKDYNKIQINSTIRRDQDNNIIDRSTMVNIRTETAEEALLLYSNLKEKLNGELSPNSASAKQTEISYKQVGKICPKCGRVLVRRQAAKGGDFFMGCVGYPKCRYTEQMK